MRTLFDDHLGLGHTSDFDDVETDASHGSNIRGTSGNDDLSGGEGNDTIRGLGGSDYITGGQGDDLLFGGQGNDHLYDYNGGSDTLSGDIGDDSLEIDRFASPPAGTAEHISMDGGAGNDVLTLDAELDTAGNTDVLTTLSGGDGDDYIAIDGAPHATVDAGAGADTIQASAGQDAVLTLGEGADVLHMDPMMGAGGSGLIVTDFETGNGGDRIELRGMLTALLPGWEQNNPFGDGHLRLIQHGSDATLQLDADGGGDSWSDLIVFQDTSAKHFTAFNLDGFPPDGSDPVGMVITGTDAWEDFDGTTGGDTINGMGGDDSIFGYAGNDSLLGGAGDDELNGGFGADTLVGGDGDDQITASGEDVALGGTGDDNIRAFYDQTETGMATLNGGDGADQIEIDLESFVRQGAVVAGGDGDDTIYVSGAGKVVANGGAGDDHFELSDVGTKVSLTLGAGVDTVELYTQVDASTLVTITDFKTGATGDRLDLQQVLNDDLTGWDQTTNPFAAGFLRLQVEGYDTALQYSANGDGVWQDLFLLKHVAPGELTQENLSGYPGDGAAPNGMLIHGTSSPDDIFGGIGPDTIDGGAGNDELFGAAGDDSVIGGAGDDYLEGDYGADLVSGGAGEDSLQGSGGAATLLGGTGDDQLFVSDDPGTLITGKILLDGGAGQDQIEWSISQDDYTTAEIDGGAGDDVITLLSGSDSMRIALGAGADLVELDERFRSTSALEIRDFTRGDSLGLRNFVDWSLFDFDGDPFADGYLRLAQAGKNTIVQINWDGAGGDWQGLFQLDRVKAQDLTAKQLDGYHAGPVWLVGGDGHDKLVAKDGFTHLDGGGGADVLTGSDKADVLVGGAGADSLAGKGGPDVFMYSAVSDSTVAQHDTITDLTNADTINLSQVDADTNSWQDDAFRMIDRFDGQAGELTLKYRPASGLTVLSGDTDGDGVADFEIIFKGDFHDFSNFVL